VTYSLTVESAVAVCVTITILIFMFVGGRR